LSHKLKAGEDIAAIKLKDVQGRDIAIPSPNHRFTHLEFRRFAGCPVCNLHLRQVVTRLSEIENAGILEIAFFHSTNDALLPHVADLPLTVIGDPERIWYKKFGVERSLMGLLNPQVLFDGLKGLNAKTLLPSLSLKEDHDGLPADFLVDSKGTVVAAKYGAHASDHWSVDEILEQAKVNRP